jgi:hypothetical protein
MSVYLFASMEWFGGFQAIFFIIFALVIGMFVVTAVRGLLQWSHNNQSPRLTIDARIVTKRTSVSVHHHHHGNGAGVHHSTSTTYYVTFEVASGDRMELKVKGNEYGMLAEGDHGQLSFQGTRYLDFVRSGVQI